MASKSAKVSAKEKSSWSFNKRSLLRHLTKHTTWHKANISTPPISFPQNAERTKTMKEKTSRRTLAYARAGRRAFRRIAWPSIPSMKASIILNCHRSCIYATHFPHTLQTKNKTEKCMHASAKARQRAFWRIARPSIRQLIGAGTLPPPMHWKPRSLSHPSRIFTPCQHDTSQKNVFTPPPRPSDVAFGALPSPASSNSLGADPPAPNALKAVQFKQTFANFHTLPTLYDAKNYIHAFAKTKQRAFQHVARPNVRQQGKTLILSCFLYQLLSPLEVDGPPAPPPSSVPRAVTGVRPSYSHARFLPESITYKTNNGGTTPARTFVGTLCKCGFHPSNVDGRLIRSTLPTDVRILLYFFTRFDDD